MIMTALFTQSRRFTDQDARISHLGRQRVVAFLVYPKLIQGHTKAKQGNTTMKTNVVSVSKFERKVSSKPPEETS